MTLRTIGHEVYTHVEPDDGGKAPPPWWLIAIAARVIPSLRRKLATSARAIAAGLASQRARRVGRHAASRAARTSRAFGALVTDAGSALSHTAIVAREYGLPAVVATSNATSTIEDGEELVVDGNRVTVERLGVSKT
jgi:hypothetical protein